MPFDFQPVLQGDLLRLRPLRPDDFGELFTVASDPLIWEQHPEPDRYTEAVFKRFFQGALLSGGAMLVMDATDGHVVGSSRFLGYNQEKREIEIGFTFLARDYWGGTYNGEMKRLMLRHAFQFVDTVVFLVGQNNIRSQRALEKIDARRAGTRIGANGREALAYEIARREWLDRE